MRVLSLISLGLIVLVFLQSVVNFCSADHHKFEIVGFAECADCQENNFKTSHAFSGLHVSIDCKLKKGMKRVGESEVDEKGKFKISLPEEIIRGVQNLKECYAQLHSGAALPCPAHGGLETTKIVFKSQNDNKIITLGPTESLRFSTALCTSKFLWPFLKYPPLPKTYHRKKDWPIITKPKPKPNLKPFYKPPIVKTLPPPVPTYKPKPKPKSKPPVFKPPTKPIPKPPVPTYKPPVVTKPLLPPLFPLPPLYKKKKPCPPLIKIPPKYLDHPKFGYFPKPPPFDPIP